MRRVIIFIALVVLGSVYAGFGLSVLTAIATQHSDLWVVLPVIYVGAALVIGSMWFALGRYLVRYFQSREEEK